ncbi:MAG: hypothetical protein LAP13_25935 [Acidobacteriia bacterium]|nr:hypothetical protein [Terriglobia bacterium]
MQYIVILEWTYTPTEFFEEAIHIGHEDYQMKIEGGKVEARIRPDIYDKIPMMRDALHEALNFRFLSRQFLTHKLYSLSKSSESRLYPDGRKNVRIFAESIMMTCAVGSADILLKDTNGNVIIDSRQDRVHREKELGTLVEKHRSKDKLIALLLKSYSDAVNDPKNELVHLYQIQEALTTRFGKKKAPTKLGIDPTQWDGFKALADDKPLRQGRHRGRNADKLRDATEAELEQARTFVRKLIEAYLRYIDREACPKNGSVPVSHDTTREVHSSPPWTNH